MEWLDAARSGGCTLLVWFAFNSGWPALHRRSAEAGLNCSLNENSGSAFVVFVVVGMTIWIWLLFNLTMGRWGLEGLLGKPALH